MSLQPEAVTQAALAWADFTENDQTMVRIGLTPRSAFEAASKAVWPVILSPRDFTLALFACAEREGGMIA